MKNTIKIIATVILTISAYRYAQIERGYTAIIGGGEMFIPPLCILLFWGYPIITKEIKKEIKNIDWSKLYEDEY